MGHGSTFFLRGVIILIGALVLALCIIALPAGITTDQAGYYRPILFGLYLPAIPFFLALHQALKLLTRIDANTAFSDLSVISLRKIKRYALVIGTLFLFGMPYIFMAAQQDDAPGLVLIALIITAASFVIATFAAVMQKLFQSAIEIKSENDLTV